MIKEEKDQENLSHFISLFRAWHNDGHGWPQPISDAETLDESDEADEADEGDEGDIGVITHRNSRLILSLGLSLLWLWSG